MDPGTERFRRRKRSARLGGGAIGQLKRLFLVMAAIDTPEVVKLLGELAQQAALRGGNPYRARVYARAAESLGSPRSFTKSVCAHPGPRCLRIERRLPCR
jgi:hypothetical protein